LVPAAFAPTPVSRKVDGRRPVVKIIAESLSQHDGKHVPTPLISSPTSYNLTNNLYKSGSDEERLAICHTGLLVQMPVSHIVHYVAALINFEM
jgi:hypothetical protein